MCMCMCFILRLATCCLLSHVLGMIVQSLSHPSINDSAEPLFTRSRTRCCVHLTQMVEPQDPCRALNHINAFWAFPCHSVRLACSPLLGLRSKIQDGVEHGLVFQVIRRIHRPYCHEDELEFRAGFVQTISGRDEGSMFIVIRDWQVFWLDGSPNVLG